MINKMMAPKTAMNNRFNLSLVKECACYACVKIFEVSEIKEWTDTYDFRNKVDTPESKHTALCPYCQIDAIIPINIEEDKDLVNLKKIKDYWINKGKKGK